MPHVREEFNWEESERPASRSGTEVQFEMRGTLSTELAAAWSSELNGLLRALGVKST